MLYRATNFIVIWIELYLPLHVAGVDLSGVQAALPPRSPQEAPLCRDGLGGAGQPQGGEGADTEEWPRIDSLETTYLVNIFCDFF